MPISPLAQQRISAFDTFVRGGAHPCVMARSVLQRENARFGTFGPLGDPSTAREVCRALYAELELPRTPRADWSFVGFFDGPRLDDESAFEAALWRQLQAMHDCDSASYDWDRSVSSDPAEASFSFSIGGQAWYVIGLHPVASRVARRFESVALVFNPHRQFERLRLEGRYDTLKASIRSRDVALQGSVNPMLADHGVLSEARQYSGREVGADWRCPFDRRAGHGARGTGE